MDNAFISQMLSRAVTLSRQGMESTAGGPFGAVVARQDQVLGEGFNQVIVDNDPTAHAEVVAIRKACAHAGKFSLEGCVIFASSQPCPMCLGAIFWSRIDAIYYANTIEQAADAGFDDRTFYDQLALPPLARAVKQIHAPSVDALNVFKDWKRLSSRTNY